MNCYVKFSLAHFATSSLESFAAAPCIANPGPTDAPLQNFLSDFAESARPEPSCVITGKTVLPEKSALSFAYIMAHDLPAGAIVGPDRCFGALGYPKENRALPHVNEGADALFAFTEQAPADVRTESKDA